MQIACRTANIHLLLQVPQRWKKFINSGKRCIAPTHRIDWRLNCLNKYLPVVVFESNHGERKGKVAQPCRAYPIRHLALRQACPSENIGQCQQHWLRSRCLQFFGMIMMMPTTSTQQQEGNSLTINILDRWLRWISISMITDERCLCWKMRRSSTIRVYLSLSIYIYVCMCVYVDVYRHSFVPLLYYHSTEDNNNRGRGKEREGMCDIESYISSSSLVPSEAYLVAAEKGR